MRNLHIAHVLFLLVSTGPTSFAARFYWSDTGGTPEDLVRRAESDGSDIRDFVLGLQNPRGIALDQVNKRIYVIDLGSGLIRRSKLCACEEAPFTSIHDGAGDVVVDPLNGKVYWTDTDSTILASGGLSGAIRRANLDGSDVEDLVTGLIHPVAIDLNVAQGKVYWTELARNFDGMGSIQRANLDGSDSETLLDGIDEANGLAIDPLTGRMYWTELSGQKIQSANLDGTDVIDILTGLDGPTQIDLQLGEGNMYWTSFGGQSSSAILRANLDGTGMETLISGNGVPWGIAVVPEPAPVVLCAIACGILLWSNHTSRSARIRPPHSPPNAIKRVQATSDTSGRAVA